MRRPHWVLMLLVSCSRIPGTAENAEAKPHASNAPAVTNAVASAPAPLTGAAAAFQRSYDEEAAGRLDAAHEALDALPSPHNESYVTALRRGWLLYRLGRHADSITAYAKATSLEPESIESRVGALLPELAARRWRDAEATAREVLQRDPANYYGNLRLAFAVYNLGRAACEQGVALGSCREACEPECSPACTRVGRASRRTVALSDLRSRRESAVPTRAASEGDIIVARCVRAYSIRVRGGLRSDGGMTRPLCSDSNRLSRIRWRRRWTQLSRVWY
jgi:tetratricopeptide (TPR) repeat protein